MCTKNCNTQCTEMVSQAAELRVMMIVHVENSMGFHKLANTFTMTVV